MRDVRVKTVFLCRELRKRVMRCALASQRELAESHEKNVVAVRRGCPGLRGFTHQWLQS
jgi:hypothetical protein